MNEFKMALFGNRTPKENGMKQKILNAIAWILAATLGIPIAFTILFGFWIETIVLISLILYIGWSLDKEREAKTEKRA